MRWPFLLWRNAGSSGARGMALVCGSGATACASLAQDFTPGCSTEANEDAGESLRS